MNNAVMAPLGSDEHERNTKVQLRPKWAGQFDSFSKWVSRASEVLDHRAICVDVLGRRCVIGKDFMRARDENAFPIRYFWEMEPAAPAVALQELCDDPLTVRRAAMLMERGGRKVTGFILQPESGPTSLVHHGATRKLDALSFYTQMHDEAANREDSVEQGPSEQPGV